MRFLYKAFKWLLLVSLLLTLISWLRKDILPDPEFYAASDLNDPVQLRTSDRPFRTVVNDQQYEITPLFDYTLDGVVVSYHNADSLGGIWHHDRWKDFVNVRDLCVIWGQNVDNGVYQSMDFKNDSWTCWAYWPDRATGDRFSMTQLSNNHLLTDDDRLRSALMSVEPGDHVRLRGVLASYSNPSNNFHRRSSTTRTDTGNGACETIYLRDVEIVRKANQSMRRLFTVSGWLSVIGLIGLVVTFIAMPVSRHHVGDRH